MGAVSPATKPTFTPSATEIVRTLFFSKHETNSTTIFPVSWALLVGIFFFESTELKSKVKQETYWGAGVLKLELLSPQRSNNHIPTRRKKCHRDWEETLNVRCYHGLPVFAIFMCGYIHSSFISQYSSIMSYTQASTKHFRGIKTAAA